MDKTTADKVAQIAIAVWAYSHAPRQVILSRLPEELRPLVNEAIQRWGSDQLVQNGIHSVENLNQYMEAFYHE